MWKQKSQLLILIVLLLPSLCSALTLQDICIRARLAIGEPDSGVSYFTNSELRKYGEDGRNYIEGFGIGIIKQSKTALAAGQETYTLPTDYLTWLSVWIKTTDSLIPLDYTDGSIICNRFERGWDNARYPVEFAIYRDSQIVICPYPAAAIDTLVIKYSAESNSLDEDSANCTLPYPYQLWIVDYIVAQCYLKDGKIQEYQVLMNMVDERIERYAARTYRKSTIPESKEVLKEE